jgi:hypothetical protein
MIKSLPLLFSCLLFSGSLFAQTAQDTVPAVKDSNAAPKKMEPVAPSGGRTRDSTRPVRIRTKPANPTASPAQPVHKDSVAHRDSVVRRNTALPASSAPAKDSVVPGSNTVPVISTAAGNSSAGGSHGLRQDSLWKATLSSDPFFNFAGKPVVESEVIHRPDSRDGLFYLLLGILFYFALVRVFYEKYFGHLITLFFRASIRQQQIREQVLQSPLPSLMMNWLFILTGGLYACYVLRYYQFGTDINFWLLYLDCMLALGLIYLVKFLVLKFCGWVFNISRATDTYIFVVFLVNKMLGIFLLPFLILITFSSPMAQEIYITISLVMIFVFLIYRILASFRPIRNEIKLTPFHFFLYLCAFEIAPLLLIYKVLLTYLEKGS